MSDNLCIKLASYAEGAPTLENFLVERAERPAPGAGEALVRVEWISVDPYMFGRIKQAANYAAGVHVGEVMHAHAVGEIIASNRADRAVGDKVVGLFGMQSFSIDGPQSDSRVLDPALGPPRLALTLLGMVGLTAYFGLLDIGAPSPGETVLVSAGAGAVGSIVCAIAKIKGCRAVAITGSDDKVAHCVTNLGYDAAVNRHDRDVAAKLAVACPNGVDIYFDNTGGPSYDLAIANMAVGGRIVACGRIASAHLSDPAEDVGPRDTHAFIVKRLMKKGLLVSDYEARFPEALAELARWSGEGRFSPHEDVLRGVEQAPEGLMRLLSGQNVGKQLIEVAHEES